VQYAKIFGGTVAAIDITDEKLQLAKELGADIVIDARSEDPAEVRGQAHRVCHPAELSRLRRDAAIWPWPGGDRDVYVRILPGTVTGRRLVAP
jgi:threonine dehydrogenase-like Zn-dependent dehydrogenase